MKAQPFINSDDELLNGYSGKISGNDYDGKIVLVHLCETGGKEALFNLINGLTGNQLNVSGADVTGILLWILIIL